MPNKFERKESYLPNEILNFLPDPKDYPIGTRMKSIKRDYDNDLMKMGSDRYYTFRKSLKCSFCNLEGSIFYKERHISKKGIPLSESYHFNLYAINENGEEVLMTKDHIIPKAKGGRDTLNNYQTCCSICNEKKSATDDKKFRKSISL